MDEIKQLIAQERYEEAGELFFNLIEEGGLNEEMSILGATIALRLNQPDLAFSYIRKGLEINQNNYELYLCLGDYYINNLNPNINQAYLCYENAYYLCMKQYGVESDDSNYILDIMHEVQSNEEFSVVPASIIILPWNTLELTKACVESIRNNCYEGAYELVLIDNALFLMKLGLYESEVVGLCL